LIPCRAEHRPKENGWGRPLELLREHSPPRVIARTSRSVFHVRRTRFILHS
jgi:hypothetical protein